MKHYIIGDVHGMLDSLKELIVELNLNSDDNIVFVGDLIDKGPDSAGVVKFVRKLSQTNKVTIVEGNHEDKHRRFRKNLQVRPETAASMAENMPELQHITDRLSEEDINFLNSAVPFYRVPNMDILVVHGGIPGDMVDFPLTVEETKQLTGKRKKKFNLIMRTRYVDSETGKMLQLGKETESDPFWAKIYDGRFGYVVFGHEPFYDKDGGLVSHYKYATGIDTGAVFGGGLTAMIVNEDSSQHFLTINTEKFANPFNC